MFKKSLSIFFNQVLGLFLSLIITFITARLFGADGRGTYVLYTTFPVVILTFLNLGMGNSIIYFIGKNLIGVKEILRKTSVISLGVFFVLIIFSFFFRKSLQPILLPESPVWAFYALLIASFFSLLLNYNRYIYLGTRDIFKYNLYNLLPNFGILIGLLIIYIYNFKLSKSIALVLIIIYLILYLISSIDILKKNYNEIRNTTSNLFNFISYGMKNYIGAISNFMSYRMDIYIIAFFLTNVEVGIYSIAVTLSELVLHIPRAIGTALFSEIASYDNDFAIKEVARLNRITLFFVLILGICLIFFSIGLVPVLFGDEYISSLVPLSILTFATIFNSITKILSNYFIGQGLATYYSWASILTLVLVVIFDFILIQKMGIIGAALASLIGYSSGAILLVILFKSKSKITISDLLIIKSKDFNYLFKRIKK